MMRTTRDVHSMSVPQTLSGPMPSVHGGKRMNLKKAKELAGRTGTHIQFPWLSFGGVGGLSLCFLWSSITTQQRKQKGFGFPTENLDFCANRITYCVTLNLKLAYISAP